MTAGGDVPAFPESLPAAVGSSATSDVLVVGAPAGTDHDAAAAPSAARRRRRQVVARPHAVQVKFSAAEFEVVTAAAAAVGLTRSGYVASVAVATARGQMQPLPASTGDVVRELVAARTQLRRYGTLLNQAVAKLNATGEADLALGAALERCEASTAAVRAAVERLGRSSASHR